ncbi:MAG: hypothetical protein ACOCWO_03985 [Candidatus Muiribacteriaceae bacterium]
MPKNISIFSLHQGMQLARPLFHNDVCLLEAGKVLTESHIRTIKKLKVTGIVVH